MKLQVLVLFATLAATLAQEYLNAEDRDAKEDAEWEKFKVHCLVRFFYKVIICIYFLF